MCDSAERIPFEDPTDVFYTNVDYQTIRNKATGKPKAPERAENKSDIPSKTCNISQQRTKRKQAEEVESLIFCVEKNEK